MATSQQDLYQDWQSTKKTVLERSRYMFNNPFMSDVALSCDGSDKKFFAHKYVLGTSSAVFYAMFYGELAEKNSVVNLSDTDDVILEQFLRFLYTDECNLTEDNAMLVLYLAKKYIVPLLADKCIEFLKGIFTEENVLTLLDQADQLDERKLENKCWDFIELNASVVINSAAFTDIKQTTLVTLLKRDALNVKEVDLFKAVVKWSEAECSRKGIEANPKNKRTVLGNAIYQVRFLSMTAEEFAKNVSRTGVLSAEELVLFYGTLSGLKRLSRVWNMTERSVKNETLLRCSRFGEYTINESIGKRKARNGIFNKTLCVVFSKSVKFYGVRMLGDKGNSYDVTLKINSLPNVINGKFKAQKNSRGISGFDVMLPTPITVQASAIVCLQATIEGKFANLGINGRGAVETEGIIVNFFNLFDDLSSTVKKGQFDEIIFGEVKCKVQHSG